VAASWDFNFSISVDSLRFNQQFSFIRSIQTGKTLSLCPFCQRCAVARFRCSDFEKVVQGRDGRARHRSGIPAPQSFFLGPGRDWAGAGMVAAVADPAGPVGIVICRFSQLAAI
jgi:hypothetical protein